MSDDPKPLIAELSRLLSRELLLSVPKEEFPSLGEVYLALRRAEEFLDFQLPPEAKIFLNELSQFHMDNGFDK